MSRSTKNITLKHAIHNAGVLCCWIDQAYRGVVQACTHVNEQAYETNTSCLGPFMLVQGFSIQKSTMCCQSRGRKNYERSEKGYMGIAVLSGGALAVALSVISLINNAGVEATAGVPQGAISLGYISVDAFVP